jgi:hypothetical protein
VSVDPGIAQRGIGSPWDNIVLSQAGGDPSMIALAKAVIARESAWNPAAVNPVDPSYGLMQLLAGPSGPYPAVAIADLLNPITSITLGMAHLRYLVARYPILADAISAYNAGHPLRQGNLYANEGYVDDVLWYFDWYLQHDPLLGSAGPAPVPMYFEISSGQAVDPGNVGTDPATGTLIDTTTGNPVAVQEPAPAGVGLGIAAVIGAALLALGRH